MVKDFENCPCGAGPMFIRIQNVWHGMSGDVGVVECEACQRFEPFKYYGFGPEDARLRAIVVWNKAIKRERRKYVWWRRRLREAVSWLKMKRFS